MQPNETPQQQDAQPVGFELEQEDVYGKYILSAPLDIMFVLQTMVKRGCMASVYFNQAKSFFLTCLLAISKDQKSLILDIGSDSATNREALKADHLLVSANLDSVKIQFTLRGLKETTFEGKPAFLSSPPKNLLRLQRREYFRLEISRVNPLRCQVPIREDGKLLRTLDLNLLDISGGGLGLMAPSDVGQLFKVGAIFQDCRLDLPDEGVITTTLCIRSCFPINTKDGRQNFRIGSEFVNLPGTRLTMIQRYITRIERQRKAKESGLE